MKQATKLIVLGALFYSSYAMNGGIAKRLSEINRNNLAEASSDQVLTLIGDCQLGSPAEPSLAFCDCDLGTGVPPQP